jgi:NADH-quinone oxidoreductase subunit L
VEYATTRLMSFCTMPITFWTTVLGTLALVATPFFSGYYSKDTIIEAAKHAADGRGWIGSYGYWAVLAGAFVTSFYSFRLLYMTYFGAERFREVEQSHPEAQHGPLGQETRHEPSHLDAHGHHADDSHHGVHEPHESPWVVTVPLVLLAIPSILVGFFTAGPMLFGTDWAGHADTTPFFAGAIEVLAAHDVMAQLKENLWHGPVAFALHGFLTPAFWLTFAGFLLATVMYVWRPGLAPKVAHALRGPIRVLENKYGMDDLWIKGFAGGSLLLGRGSREVDSKLIDGVFVNGAARLVDFTAGLVRRMQTGYLYHYAFAMIVGLIVLLAVLIRNWT